MRRPSTPPAPRRQDRSFWGWLHLSTILDVLLPPAAVRGINDDGTHMTDEYEEAWEGNSGSDISAGYDGLLMSPLETGDDYAPLSDDYDLAERAVDPVIEFARVPDVDRAGDADPVVLPTIDEGYLTELAPDELGSEGETTASQDAEPPVEEPPEAPYQDDDVLTRCRKTWLDRWDGPTTWSDQVVDFPGPGYSYRA